REHDGERHHRRGQPLPRRGSLDELLVALAGLVHRGRDGRPGGGAPPPRLVTRASPRARAPPSPGGGRAGGVGRPRDPDRVRRTAGDRSPGLSAPLHGFPLVIWAALRFGQIGTTVLSFVVSGVAIWSTANGLGPFALATAHESLVMLQLFMAVVAGSGLLLGAAIAERDAAEARRAADYGAL